MTDAQRAIDSAIQECERLRRIIRSGNQQVRSDEEKQIIKATAHAWYNNHRKPVCQLLRDDQLKLLDDEYKSLLGATGRATLRGRYLEILKQIKKNLIQLQADHAIALSNAVTSQQPTSDLAPQFSSLIADAKMQSILSRRWQECINCLSAGAPLAATVMMGGILEGLLLARINQTNDKSQIFKSAAAPKDKNNNPLKLNEWGLKNYMDVAHELNWISKTTKTLGK